MIEILRRRWADTAKRRTSGQALVEFVLVFPLFITILFAIIDFGWMAYQKAAFDYSRIHTSWDYAGLDVNNPSSTIFKLGYEKTGPTESSETFTKGVSDAVKDSIKKAPSIGFDTNELTVENAKVTISNVPSESTVPDRKGDATKATRVTRQARLEATVKYNVKPIIGLLIQPVEVTENIDVTHVVGDQTRTY